MDADKLAEKIIKVLKTVYDPEIPVDIYELGLIYDVLVNDNSEVKIIMTLTTPNCPVADSLPKEVEDKVKLLSEVNDAKVELTFEPPWTRDLMSEEAKLELGFLQMKKEIINKVSRIPIHNIDISSFIPKNRRVVFDTI